MSKMFIMLPTMTNYSDNTMYYVFHILTFPHDIERVVPKPAIPIYTHTRFEYNKKKLHKIRIIIRRKMPP